MGGQRGIGVHIVFLSLFSLATMYTCLGAQNITTGCSEHERLALLKFKNIIKNDYKMFSSWVGKDCCSWKGVRCDGASGSVVGLDLRGNLQYFNSCGGRFGTAVDENYLLDEKHFIDSKEMDSSLAELRHLEYLDLSGNYFHGSQIPEFVGTLKQLSYLNLSNAGFSGNIPHYIGNLSNLKVLDLNSYSQELMVGDMAWISGLSSLDHLDLSGVDLSGARNRHRVLYMIPSLTDLSLSCCGFANSDLAGPHLNSSRMLPNIRRLDLSWNWIEGRFPSVLTNMSSLLALDLSGNLLDSSIPIIPSLQKLVLSHNDIQHIEHIGIWGQCHLKHLSVSENYLGELNGPSTNISNCSHYAFELLDLSRNGFTGFLPESFGRLTSLRVLYLGSNSLKGPIPKALGRLRFLERLDLSYNQLDGPIPTITGQLKELNLQNNQLTGPIPASLGGLASLEVFSVSSNSLNGTLPVQIGQLTKLNYLDISNNSLEGVILEAHFANHLMLKYLDATSNPNLTVNISREWMPPFQLRILRMGSCKIAAEFPQWLRNQTNLRELDLSNSSISGNLPTWMRKMPLIPWLDLSYNKLTGPLTNLPCGNPLIVFWLFGSNFYPESLHLERFGLPGPLYLKNNLFTGPIPKSLCKWTHLEILDLSLNRISGKIPRCLENLINLKAMVFSSNELSGVIPDFRGNLSESLTWLDFNNNNLSGVLPNSLGNFYDLRVLDLGDNSLSGSIPKWMGDKLVHLVILRLHKNYLSGRLPRSLCLKKGLQILDISQNNITGVIPSCFKELSGMVIGSHESIHNGTASSNLNIRQVMKGVDLRYTTTLQLVVNMDLSSNKLVGEIPEELTNLSMLVGLNLSHNNLSGSIPDNIGNLKALISLDFSANELTGTIPSCLSALNFLTYLNLSHNNLSGRIPTGNQLQTLTDPSIYAGNRDLCGAPLPRNCSNPDDPPTIPHEPNFKPTKEPKKVWFYLDIIGGFATGFWGIIGVLVFKKRWRQKLFIFSERTMDKIYVAFVVRVAKIKRRREA
uniref:receptor-like protein 49 n=1 Tax=Erigeron canadensis TaxID=72917 RepID=UPI001CB955D8|nr:receptor-like protein 49 [Erigeron canadensis]